MIEFTPDLRSDLHKPVYLQLSNYIKELILKGDLKAGERLPSIRHLSDHLGISKNTVVTAYDQLMAEGYIASSGRSGIYVETLLGSTTDNAEEKAPQLAAFFLRQVPLKPLYDLRNAQIDTANFPYATWRKVLSQCIHEDNCDLLNYGEHQGEEELRLQIARYLFSARGVSCTPNQILIGSGTQQSLSMLSMLLRDTGENIAFEEPGYNGARQVFVHQHYHTIPIALEPDGINIKHLEDCPASIVYITPSHQFPCGMVMPVNKRLQLLKWAQNRNGYIIEDDYDGEFRYQGKPIPALQGLDVKGNVIYLGTFSKSLIPSARISYMVLPYNLLRIYKEKYSIYEQPVPRVMQKALQLFMEQGYWDRHIKKMRNVYKKKHDLLLQNIGEQLMSHVEVIGKDAGLHVLLHVKNGMSERELIHRASEVGVAISPTSIYWADKTGIDSPLVFIGFGGIALADIPESIRRLNQCWFT